MKMEQGECSKMSAFKIQTPENYPEESIQHSEHGKIKNESELSVFDDELLNTSKRMSCTAATGIIGEICVNMPPLVYMTRQSKATDHQLTPGTLNWESYHSPVFRKRNQSHTYMLHFPPHETLSAYTHL